MLWNCYQGYSNSIDWDVTTTAEVIEFPALKIEGGLMQHEIKGEKYLLQERYSGSRIKRNITNDQLYITAVWLGLCLFLAASTYFKRFLFFVMLAAFTLMLNRLSLFEVGLFGIHSKMVILIPFGTLVIPLIYFHEYRKRTPFLVRLGALLLLSLVLLVGVKDSTVFTDHLIAHSLYSFGICALLFFVIVSEEIIYSMLFVVTSGKGGKSNHLHFTILSLIYLGNLTLYYLNKARLFENSFFFFDPFILLGVSCLVAIWSLQYKKQLVENGMPPEILIVVFAALGILTLNYLSLSMHRGVDAVYESMHYFILYFHIGFGAFFFIYIFINFIDPLIKGFEVHKIAYRERNFPYVTARLGGLVCICAFYFLSDQQPYNLLRSGYLSYLSQIENTSGNKSLSKVYLTQAAFLGYNTHYPNYQLGWMEWDAGKEFSAKTNFFSATQRYPSTYALINYGNIDVEVNPSKVQANYEESLRKSESAEIKNNLGIIHLDKRNPSKALTYFENIEASQDWNQAPLVNKWNVYQKIGILDSTATTQDYQMSNFGVKSNILATLSMNTTLDFVFDQLDSTAVLHRQAYLLNSSYTLSHDSISHFLKKEIDHSTDGSTINRLSKARALHLYRSGEVTKAFLILDELQANAPQYKKGEYLDALGKLAIDQSAYRLALDFFEKALAVKYENARISKIEALAALGRQDELRNELLKVVKNDPGLTQLANNLLDKLESYVPIQKEQKTYSLVNLSDTLIIQLGKKNAFNEELIVSVVQALTEKKLPGGYELLIDAIEVNPYSDILLKKYIMVALDWNLLEYAEQSLARLESIISADDFKQFEVQFENKKKEVEQIEW